MRRAFQSSFAKKSDDSADNAPDLLKSLYDKLWSNIWNKENRVWTFLAFYSAGIALALNSGLLTQFGLLAPFIVVQLTAWGVQIIIDGDWWSIRNRLMVEQIERRYSHHFTAVVPSEYQLPRFSADSLYRFSIVVLVALGGVVFETTVLRYAAPHHIHSWEELIGLLGLVLLALIHIATFLSIRENQIDSYYQLFSKLRADEERIRPPPPPDRPIVPMDAIRASQLASRRAQRMRWMAVLLAIIVFGTVDWVVGSQPGLRFLFLWIGIGCWTLLVPAARPWLRRWQPLAASLLGLLVFSPVLAWNAAHDWAGVVKQGGRVGDWQPMRALGFLGELIAGQIGLATPLVWGLCMAGLAVATRRAWRNRDPAWSLLAALSLPPVVVFLQHAVGDRVQGNWPAIIYPALAVAAGGLVQSGRERWWIAAAALGFTLTAVVYVQAATGVIPLPPRLDPIAVRLAGWEDLARQVEASRTATGAAYVAADGYALASELAWRLPAGLTVIGVDARWTLTTLPKAAIAGQSGLLVRDVRRRDPPDPAVWADAGRIGTVATVFGLTPAVDGGFICACAGKPAAATNINVAVSIDLMTSLRSIAERGN